MNDMYAVQLNAVATERNDNACKHPDKGTNRHDDYQLLEMLVFLKKNIKVTSQKTNLSVAAMLTSSHSTRYRTALS